ncbi:MAG TPA: hypothetical protein VE010_15430 [Thermoanaerobaculia bacterium]|nr:hypothetical protein [Thermoanaerobaculia bacterium]
MACGRGASTMLNCHMRRIVLLASLLVAGLQAPDALAAANLKASTGLLGISPGGVAGRTLELYLGVFNPPIEHGAPLPDPAIDVVVTIPVPPGSRLTETDVPEKWTCGMEGQAIVCRTPEVGPWAELSLGFAVQLSDQVPLGTLTYVGTAEAANSARVEFEASYYISGLIIVTTTNDSGAGSLRDAILRMNAAPGTPWKVEFALPPSSTFEPLTPLPAITTCSDITMDVGGESTGSIEAARPYALSGARVSSGSGLELRPNCSENQRGSFHLTGLAIGGFPVDGIEVRPVRPRQWETDQ